MAFTGTCTDRNVRASATDLNAYTGLNATSTGSAATIRLRRKRGRKRRRSPCTLLERLRAQGREGLRRRLRFVPAANESRHGRRAETLRVHRRSEWRDPICESNDDASSCRIRQDQSETGGAEIVIRRRDLRAPARLSLGMTRMNDEFKTLKKFDAGNGREGFFHSLPALEEQGVGKISRLPVSIRIVLESVLRNCDGKKVRRKDVETLANWNAKKPANEEIPFVVARIVLAGFHRRAAGGRSGGDAQRGEATGRRSENHRAARAGRSGGRSLGPGRFLRFGARVAAESGHGIQAQPRALPISEMGPAGVQNLRAHSARHRHRSPGESRISRQRRSFAQSTLNDQLINFSIPTRSSAPIRTRR